MMKNAVILMLASCMVAGCGSRNAKKWWKSEGKEAARETYMANTQKDFTGLRSPDFSLPDMDGNIWTLSEFPDDKYLVLDFWGAWCHSCVAELPEMKRCYEKYRSRVEFIGIDNNDGEGAWKRAVRKYELPWTQLRDDDSQTGPVYLFGIYLYPTKILLTPDKTVLRVFKGDGPEFFETLDELFGQKE